MTPETNFYPPILHSDEWIQPVPLSEAINTAGGEDSAFVMPDGNTLCFFFTPDVSILAEEQVADSVTRIYVSRRQIGARRSSNTTTGKPKFVDIFEKGKCQTKASLATTWLKRGYASTGLTTEQK